MKVAHFGGYSPTSSGMYESARDFVRADILAGRDAVFVDVGSVSPDGVRAAPKIGEVDDRGDWPLVVHGIEDARDADVWVFHDSPPNAEWGSAPPIVWIMHGRPAASYRIEAYSKGALRSYSHFAEASRLPDISIVATMIQEHMPYWLNVIPREKLRLIDHPPIDPSRYSPDGPKYKWSPEFEGKYNVVLADSWREDVDIFDVLNAACLAAEQLPGIKIHCFGAVQAGMAAINPLRDRLKELGAMGEWHGREVFLADVFRAADCVLTPHTIPTRIITEALACGCNVVAGVACRYTLYTSFRHSGPDDMAAALLVCLSGDVTPDDAPEVVARKFNLKDFGTRMGELYAEAGTPSKSSKMSPQ